MVVWLYVFVVTEQQKVKTSKDYFKAERQRDVSEPDNRHRVDVWRHLISLITDMHLGKSTNTQIRNRRGSSVVGGGIAKQGESNTHIQTQTSAPEPSYPEVIPAATARNFPPSFSWQSYSTSSLVKFNLWLTTAVGVYEQKDFFSPFPPWGLV